MAAGIHTAKLAIAFLVLLGTNGTITPAASQPGDDRAICERSMNVPSAIAACSRILESAGSRDSPQRRIALARRAFLQIGLGQQEQAVADYTALIALAPANARAFAGRAESHYGLFAYDRAIADATEAIKLDPKLGWAWSIRSIAHSHNGQHEKAVADADMAITIDAQNKFAYLNRAIALVELRRLDEAVRDVDASLRLDANNHVAWNVSGLVHLERHDAKMPGAGHLDAAIADFQKAIALRPTYLFGFHNLGRAYMRQGKNEAAVTEFDKVISLQPRYVHGWINRGWSHLRLGHPERAVPDFRQALALNPNQPSALQGLAKALEARQELPEALKFWRIYLEKVPGDQEARSVVVGLEQRIIPAPASTPTAPIPAAVPASSTPAIAPERPSVDKAITAPTRVALVIGNGAYKGVPALNNPPRDAELIASSLRDMGFKTVHAWRDLSRAQMLRALRDFSSVAAHADWAVVYFAGHGIEIDGRNYLLPVDVKLRRDIDVEDEAIALDRVLKEVETAKKLRLVILDACRNNPFSAQMKRSVSTRSIGDTGLAKVERQPQGTVLLYAAEPGSFALDNINGSPSQNSPFAEALARHMRRPNLDISRMFRAIAADVRRSTQNQQQPYYTEGSLPDEDLVFHVQGG